MREQTHPVMQPLPDEVPPVAFLLPLGIGLLLFAWPTLVGLAGVYRTDGNFSHGFLVPVISAYAAWRLRHDVPLGFTSRQWVGCLPLVAGVALILFSRWYELALLPRGVIAVFVAGLGLVAVATGLAWLASGWPGLRRLAFPLGFLLLAVPVPSFLLHRVTLPLQQLAARLSAAALHGIGVTVERQGSVLQFPSGLLGVDEACSGIRSLAVLLAVALAMVHFNRLSRRAAAVLLATVVPLAVLANALRVFISGIFCSLGWMHLTHGGPHELLGLLTFALAIGAMAVCSSLFSSRPWGAAALPPTAAPPTAAPPTAPSALRAPRVALSGLSSLANPSFCAALLLFAAAAVSLGLDTHYDRLYAGHLARLASRRSLSGFPAQVGAYTRLASHDLSEGEFRMLDPSEQSIGTYLGPDGRRFSVTILYWDPPSGRPSRRPDLLKRPHSPDWCYPAAGWQRLGAFDAACPADVFPGEEGRVRVFERDGQRLVLLFWTGVTAARTDAPDQVFQRLTDMLRSWRSPPLANLHTVTVATAANGDPAGARDAAMAFARELARVLPEYGIGRLR